MIIIEYLSKSYNRFLQDLPQHSTHPRRFLITFNGASPSDLSAATNDIRTYTSKEVELSSAVADKQSESHVAELFSKARSSRDIIQFDKTDLLFERKTAVRNSHEQESSFDINNLFKNIAKHNGIVILATEKAQTLTAAMSSKVDVVIRFPSV
ncbi:AAA family ATPase [Psychromonas ossibalaenae]|uniref:AAA family ATPase n=1 Tax=Psychromonas ossibalaenae TaxID=444922 RepID=UPI00037F0256|nr:AAA family ATPase [Psychromonas ossibalaenae]